MLYLVILSVLCVGVFGVFTGMTIMQKNTIASIIHVLCLLLVVFVVVCETKICMDNTLAVMNQAIEQGATISVPESIQKYYNKEYK